MAKGVLDKNRLTAFQIERLKNDYRDFLEDPEHRRLATFFFDQVYSTQNKKVRDLAFERIRRLVAHRLGTSLADSLDSLKRLNEITDRMDESLLATLQELDCPIAFTVAEYERAYRLLDNYELRREQIDLMCAVIDFFWELTRKPTVTIWLRVTQRIARVLGAGHFATFLEEGYQAFREIRSIQAFRSAIRERETARLDRIFHSTRAGG